MTHSFRMNRRPSVPVLLTMLTTILVLASCSKTDDLPKNQVSHYSSEVVDKWMTLQVRLMKNAVGIPNQALSRQFAYSGIAALEAVRPGLPGFAKWYSKWNGLTGLPAFHPSDKYYYPANVNATLAEMNRKMFPNATAADKVAIDSLENALYASFSLNQQQTLLTKSSDFGKSVATAVFNWSETDGYKNGSAPYTPPTGPGLWVPTPPAFAPAASPYWGNVRTVVTNSLLNTQPPAPIAYSTDPSSPFYQMVKHVYDASQVLTPDQKAAAIFWRDIPGVSSPGHWLSILHQVIKVKNATLDKSVLAYALTGASINDAVIGCWQAKYQHNLVRPITYIRNVMGHSTWNSFIGTPAHPEYVSGHSVLSSAAAEALNELFGNIGSFTDHTYDYMGLPARTYNSFNAIAEEAGNSRLWGGIHYQQSIDLGLIQGTKVAENIFTKHHGFATTGGPGLFHENE